jgi:hypothetical protein
MLPPDFKLRCGLAQNLAGAVFHAGGHGLPIPSVNRYIPAFSPILGALSAIFRIDGKRSGCWDGFEVVAGILTQNGLRV